MTALVQPRRSNARLGWIVAIVLLAVDQLTKHWVLTALHLTEGGEAIRIAPFAELRLVWNHGISYGLFQQESDFGRWLLIAVSIGAAIGLAIWLTRSVNMIVAISIGLILAGAIGNAIDRTLYGAVIDFIYLFTPGGSFRWYVFNVADASIVAGVVGLLYDTVFQGRRV